MANLSHKKAAEYGLTRDEKESLKLMVETFTEEDWDLLWAEMPEDMRKVAVDYNREIEAKKHLN
jgi:hypothetical protein